MIDPTEHFRRQWEDMDPTTAEINRLTEENAKLRKALRPFSAAVYNDNGDVTISSSHIRTSDWMFAARAYRQAQEITK